MVQLTIKPDIDQSKINILLQMLKSWDLEADTAVMSAQSDEKYIPFSESFGMWKDRDIDAKELRKQASGINDRLKT